jgi:hypothetical protein
VLWVKIKLLHDYMSQSPGCSMKGSLWGHGLLHMWPAAAAALRMMQTPVAPNSGTHTQLLPATPAAQLPSHDPAHHGPSLQRPCYINKACVGMGQQLTMTTCGQANMQAKQAVSSASSRCYEGISSAGCPYTACCG